MDNKIETYMGKCLTRMSKDELIQAMNHMAAYYENRIATLNKGLDALTWRKNNEL